MSIKLTDTQRIALAAAARREDRCLVTPEKVKGLAARKFVDKLVVLGFVKEIKAKPGLPVWRMDEETERGYSLKLTAVGLKAIIVEEQAGNEQSAMTATAIGSRTVPATDARTGPAAKIAIAEAPPSESISEPPLAVSSHPAAPRGGTKLAGVIDLLTRDGGATLAEIVTATDWLPHTTRAALTGLRKRGYQVTLDRSDKERGSVYKIATGSAA